MRNSDFIKGSKRFARLRWVFGSKKWLGKEVKYYKKMRKVTAESFNYIQLEGIEHPINKRNYRNLNGKFQ
jgi:hypothetical protein